MARQFSLCSTPLSPSLYVLGSGKTDEQLNRHPPCTPDISSRATVRPAVRLMMVARSESGVKAKCFDNSPKNDLAPRPPRSQCPRAWIGVCGKVASGWVPRAWPTMVHVHDSAAHAAVVGNDTAGATTSHLDQHTALTSYPAAWLTPVPSADQHA